FMSDATKSESKPARSTNRTKPRTKSSETPPADEAEDFGAGIVEEPKVAAPAAAEPKPARAAPPRPRPEHDGEARRPHPHQTVDPNEHGFDAETNSRYEEIKRGNTYITELQHMTIVQLQGAAKSENIPREEYVGLKKQDLIFRILKERVKANGLMFGEGTLEVLPDGFGFLRSPDYNYLPCPDDI